MDGLKPSQRKVLFACFKRNLKQEIKVAQLAGMLSAQRGSREREVVILREIERFIKEKECKKFHSPM